MINFRGSTALNPSDKCTEALRAQGQDNVDWLNMQIQDLRRSQTEDTFVVLIGGRASVYDFRLQVAQSHLRADLTPSHWSHAAVISTPTTSRLNARTRIMEVSLEPYEGFQVPSMHNGIQAAPIARYADPGEYPNVAVIRVPVSRAAWMDNHGAQKSILAQFADQRAVLDVTSLMLEWLAFVWGAGDAGNPLLHGQGIPSAAVIESLVGAAGYDMSPGLDTSATCPEALWQAAKWWQSYYDDMAIETMVTRYVIADRLREPEAGDVPTPAKAANRSKTAKTTNRPRGTTTVRLPQPKMHSADSMTAAMFRHR